jgi:hypothetical protein
MTLSQRLVELLADEIRDCDLGSAHAVCAVLVAMIPPDQYRALARAIRLALVDRMAALPSDAELALRAFEPVGLAH